MTVEDATDFANNALRLHGLLDQGWSFTFDNARRRFGTCNYRTQTISLSRPLTVRNDAAQVRDTILHEIAHALTPGAHHGAAWKLKAKEVGARPERGYDSETVVLPPSPLVGSCSMPDCSGYDRYRRPSRAAYCRKCWRRHGGRIGDTRFRLVWGPT